MSERQHSYGDPETLRDRERFAIATCSRCGATRVHDDKTRAVVGFRLRPNGRAFREELPCVPVEKLYAVARNAGASVAESESNALRAISLMHEHGLTFWPDAGPEHAALDVALQDKTPGAEDRLRAAARAYALKTIGATLVRADEVAALDEDERRRKAAAKKPERTTENGDAFEGFAQVWRGAKAFAEGVAKSVLSEVDVDLGGMDLRGAAREVRGAAADLRDGIAAFRRAAQFGEPPKKKRKKPAAQPAKGSRGRGKHVSR